MQQPFNHILTFYFNHNYFSNNIFKSIDITLAEGTPKRIRDLEIIIKSFPGGWHLLASDPHLLINKNDVEPLRIYLYCNDPYYINYTNLPNYNPSEYILYFNNLNTKPTNKENSFSIHKSEFVGETEIVQISNGKVKVPSYSNQKKYFFTDAVGNEFSSESILQQGNDSGNFILSNLPEGAVIVKSENKEVAKVFYNPKIVWKKPIGIIEIYTNPLIEHYREKGKLEYEINFDNRKTIWKYFLVDPVYQKFQKLTIISKNKEQIFNAPQNQRINENVEALVFESKTTIPISEIPGETFQLIDNFYPKQNTGKIILKNLARATPELLYRDTTKSGETIYSHIYI